MKQRKIFSTMATAALAGAMLLSGCSGDSSGSSDAVSVQAVSDVAQRNVSGNNRYSGVVEAKSVQKIKKSSKKEVEKCYVKEGDVVHKGDKLFKYNVQALQLDIQSAELELEKMQSEIDAYDTQIAEMQKELNNASANKKLKYSLEIQEAQIDRAEKEYNYKTKQQEYEKLKKSVGKTTVYSKINGVVQSVNDGSDNSDSEDSSGAYITILQNNSYRVKGTVSEMNVSSMQEGEDVTVISRLDETETWDGTINKINTDQAVKDDNDYYDSGTGEQSSKYNFYVTLSSSDNLLMGQHVYIQVGEENEEEANALKLSSAYIVQEEDGTSYVWAANARNRLEKRSVTLGTYDEFNDMYIILDGLSEEDYIAFPEEGLEEGQKTAPYEESSDTTGEDEETAGDDEVPSMPTDESSSSSAAVG